MIDSKKVLVCLVAIFAVCSAHSQEILRSTIGVGGWSFYAQSSGLSLTIGEPFVGVEYMASVQLRQGFQQPIQYQEPIEGCLDVEACNYNEDASVADDSCDFVSCLIGCTEPDACNFDPLVIADDGSCDYSCCPGPGCCDDEGMHWDEEQQICVITLHGDLDFDLCVGLSDLLEFLAVFGQCAEE